jgi:hypothetical protein
MDDDDYDNNNKYEIERNVAMQLKGLLHITSMRVTLAIGVDCVLLSVSHSCTDFNSGNHWFCFKVKCS